MKLKKYNMFEERNGFDDIDQPIQRSAPNERFHDRTDFENTNIFDDDDDDDEFDINAFDEYNPEELSNDDVIETLLSTLRKMIKNSGFEKAYVFKGDKEEDQSINIQFILNKREKIGRIMDVMNLLKKFETDILIQYEAEFELWETKSGDPLITGKFYYDEGASSSNDEDDDENLPF